jgi:hypothetical protein
MTTKTKHSWEVRERAVRMLLEHKNEYDSQWVVLHCKILAACLLLSDSFIGALKKDRICGKMDLCKILQFLNSLDIKSQSMILIV